MTPEERAPAAIKEWESNLRTPQRREYLRVAALDAKMRYDSYRAAGFNRFEALSLTIGIPG